MAPPSNRPPNGEAEGQSAADIEKKRMEEAVQRAMMVSLAHHPGSFAVILVCAGTSGLSPSAKDKPTCAPLLFSPHD